MKYHGEIPEFRARYRYLVAVVMASFFVLLGRLWQLQISRGHHHRKLSKDNFVQQLRIPTTRGRVLDRRGRLLVTNRPSFDVYVTPRFVDRSTLDRVLAELALSPARARTLRQRVLSVRGKRRMQRILLVRDITRDQFAKLEMHKAQLRGVNVLAVAHRNYVHGNAASHVLGYMNEISAAELARDKEDIYRPGDLVGRFGIERLYEAHLRGVPGRERIVVDARGRRKSDALANQLLDEPRRQEPRPGHTVVLTIDLELQRLVERTLRRYPAGAAVVLEVHTGRVLASASRPAFDPNKLSGRLSRAEAKRLLNDPYRPLLDKVFRENYFPGSTYKVVSAMAALELDAIDPANKITCKRYHHFGGRNFRCSHAHGKTDLHKAIVESCNVYFYTLAEQVGMDGLAQYARMLGLGATTGLGLNGEVPGFIPTKAWYRRKKRPFRIGFTLNAAIGQGNVKTTPIQIANLYAAIANGGKLYMPQIVERIETSDGQVVQGFKPRLRRRLEVQPATLERIQAALRDVVADRDGTGHEAALSNIAVSGKTGTAQVVRRHAKKNYWLNDHAWFAAYAPSEAPEVAVAVLIEHGGRAARAAAPVAMRIIDAYFRYVRPYAKTASRRGATGGASPSPRAMR